MFGAAEPFRPRRRDRFALFGLGLVLAVVAFWVTMSIGPVAYHGARSAELSATVSAYERTGALLVKDTGTGSYYVHLDTTAPLEPAALDDDPGSYVLASVVAKAMGTTDAYEAVTLAQAGFVALPMLWLPWTMAALFRRTRAGLAAAALPLLVPLLKGAPQALLGTEYGLDVPLGIPVYALYGLASSVLFAVLSLVVLFAARRRSWRGLVGGVVVFGVLAALCGLMRSWSGIGVVLAVAVLVALHARGWRRLPAGLAAAVAGLAILLSTQAGVMRVLDTQRAEVTGLDVAALPVSHGTWHPLYLGLSYSEDISKEPSVLGIFWADSSGWDAARKVDPDVVIASREYDAIMKDLYLAEVKAHPKTVAVMYVEKAVDTIGQNIGVFVALVVGLAVLWWRRSIGSAVRRITLMMLPAVAYGFVPPTLVMPLRYYFMELSAATSVLLVVVVAGLAAATARTLRPGAECAEHCGPGCRADDAPAVGLSVVVPTSGGSAELPGALVRLGEALQPDDEVLVVEHGPEDGNQGGLHDLASRWPADGPELRVLRSGPGLGRASGHGAVHSRGDRCLFSVDDIPVTPRQLEAFAAAPSARVLVGVTADRDRRGLDMLRRVLVGRLSGQLRGPVSVDGPWVRVFATRARETGSWWTTELVTTARRRRSAVREVVLPSDVHGDPAANRGALIGLGQHN